MWPIFERTAPASISRNKLITGSVVLDFRDDAGTVKTSGWLLFRRSKASLIDLYMNMSPPGGIRFLLNRVLMSSLEFISVIICEIKLQTYIWIWILDTFRNTSLKSLTGRRRLSVIITMSICSEEKIDIRRTIEDNIPLDNSRRWSRWLNRGNNSAIVHCQGKCDGEHSTARRSSSRSAFAEFFSIKCCISGQRIRQRSWHKISAMTVYLGLEVRLMLL